MTEDKKVLATPKVRKFARELGAKVSQIKGTERKGRITEEDVKKFINNQLKVSSNIKEDNQPSEKIKNEYNHSDFGEVEIKDITRVKKLAAKIFTMKISLKPE
jgi:pyruvate dehydrogenase E2 component (dihydrolipoamide acetyltransferase)